MEITMIGRFEEACRHQGFCPAPYMTESMAAEKMKDRLAVWRVHA